MQAGSVPDLFSSSRRWPSRCVLLVTAGLFGRTLSTCTPSSWGSIATMCCCSRSARPRSDYKGPELTRLFEGLRERMSQLPSVRDVSLSIRPLPMGGGTMAPVAIAGGPTPAAPMRQLASVGPAFFKTMQIPLVAGREFTDRDHATAPRVAVVNRRLARVFGLENPVGHRSDARKRPFEIIGVAEDALIFSLKEERRPACIFPTSRAPDRRAR